MRNALTLFSLNKVVSAMTILINFAELVLLSYFGHVCRKLSTKNQYKFLETNWYLKHFYCLSPLSDMSDF